MQGIQLAYLKPNAAASGTPTAGVVCPHCYRNLTFFNLYGPNGFEDGSLRRGYIGYCLVCRKHCEVEQFAAYGLWPISGWRIDDGQWQALQQPVPYDQSLLPAKEVVPPVVTGQGDYQCGWTPATDDAIAGALRTLHTITGRLRAAVGDLMTLHRLDRDKDEHAR